MVRHYRTLGTQTSIVQGVEKHHRLLPSSIIHESNVAWTVHILVKTMFANVMRMHHLSDIGVDTCDLECYSSIPTNYSKLTQDMIAWLKAHECAWCIQSYMRSWKEGTPPEDDAMYCINDLWSREMMDRLSDMQG